MTEAAVGHEPFDVPFRVIKDDAGEEAVGPEQNKDSLPFRGLSYISRSLDLPDAPEELLWLRSEDTASILALFEVVLTRFAHTGGLTDKERFRLELFLTTGLDDEALSLGTKEKFGLIKFPKDIATERHKILQLLRTAAQRPETQEQIQEVLQVLRSVIEAANATIPADADADADADAGTSASEEADKRHGKETLDNETQRRIVEIFEQMSPPNKSDLVDALSVYFLEVDEPPTPEQQRILAPSLKLLGKVADEIRANIGPRTSKDWVRALHVFERYVGGNGVNARSRAARQVFESQRHRHYDESADDEALLIIFEVIAPEPAEVST